MKYTIKISNYPTGYNNHDSEVEVDTRKEALIYLWALAKQDVPQFGALWEVGSFEPVTNFYMFDSKIPANLIEAVTEEVKALNGKSIEDLVVQGLNVVFEGLGRHGDDPRFIDKVTAAAGDWAEECFQECAPSIPDAEEPKSLDYQTILDAGLFPSDQQEDPLQYSLDEIKIAFHEWANSESLMLQGDWDKFLEELNKAGLKGGGDETD